MLNAKAESEKPEQSRKKLLIFTIMLTEVYNVNEAASNATAGCCDCFGYGCSCACNNS